MYRSTISLPDGAFMMSFLSNGSWTRSSDPPAIVEPRRTRDIVEYS